MKEIIKQYFRGSTANGWPADLPVTKDAIQRLAEDVRAGAKVDIEPSLVVVSVSENVDAEEVLDGVRRAFTKTNNIHCVTSCAGVVTNTGSKAIAGQDGVTRVRGVWAAFDPVGQYRTVGFSSPAGLDPHSWQQETYELLDKAYMNLRAETQSTLRLVANGNDAPAAEPLAEHLVSGCRSRGTGTTPSTTG